MKKIGIIILLLSSCMVFSQTTANDLVKLEGTWYVNMSNFKMWLKSNNHNPRFTYTLKIRKGITGLHDVVSYNKHIKEKQITGFDKPLNKEATSFVWRGKGLLALFKSKWEILYQNETWTVIHFQKTLFTAEGYDVISRQKSFEEPMLESIRLKLKELKIVDNLQVIKQN